MQTQEKNPNNITPTTGTHEHPLPQEIKAPEQHAAEAAHDAAEQDMETDADLSIHSPNDDLDESDTARLGDGENALI